VTHINATIRFFAYLVQADYGRLFALGPHRFDLFNCGLSWGRAVRTPLKMLNAIRGSIVLIGIGGCRGRNRGAHEKQSYADI
jgi:hypothetical protein